MRVPSKQAKQTPLVFSPLSKGRKKTGGALNWLSSWITNEYSDNETSLSNCERLIRDFKATLMILCSDFVPLVKTLISCF